MSTIGQKILTLPTIARRAVYYTKIFKKDSSEIWHKIQWSDNRSKDTLDKISVQVKIRTGNDLPIKTYGSPNVRYTLTELNNMIKTNPNLNNAQNQIQMHVAATSLDRFISGRSVMINPVGPPASNPILVSCANSNIRDLGTDWNSTRLASDEDAIWTYYSNSVVHNPSYIPSNINYNYLQAMIIMDTSSLTNSIQPEMFRIDFTSILKKK